MAMKQQEQQTTTHRPDLQWFWTVMGWDATTPYLYPFVVVGRKP